MTAPATGTGAATITETFAALQATRLVRHLPTTQPRHDLPDIGGDDLGDGDDGGFVTLAGLLLAGLGHIPTQPGEHVNIGRYAAEVVEVTGHAITKVG